MFDWLNDNSRLMLSRGYLQEGVSPEERVSHIAEAFEKNLLVAGFDEDVAESYAIDFYHYMGKGYYSLSSPVWSNYGTPRGFPVSCFGSVPDDSMDSIMYSAGEAGMLMKGGGGHSLCMDKLRGRGAPIKYNGKSSGSVHFLQLFDSMTEVVSQGNVRRGFITPYLSAEHPDILEFIDIGKDGNPIQEMTTGVTVSDEFMNKVFEERNPEAIEVWGKLLQARKMRGYPYIMFTGNANKQKPEVYKEYKKEIVASNMCSEIMLPSDVDSSFVCVLSSMNLLHYDEWKNTDAVEVLTLFLDTVVQEFIDKVEALPSMSRMFLQRPLKFAKEHRAIGLGVLGWHSYLQSKMIAFESTEASKLNNEIFKLIRTKAEDASTTTGIMLGMPKYGGGKRNSTVMAVAPTKSSSFILGQVSQSVEPEPEMYYIQSVAKVETTIKNKYLEAHLESIGKNTKDVWESIALYGGSVQHLDFLDDNVKEVFRTFAEIDPKAVVTQAGIRQQYIDQGQSLNLTIPSTWKPKQVNELVKYAYDMGLKSLYYQFGTNAAQELARSKLKKLSCSSCEG